MWFQRTFFSSYAVLSVYVGMSHFVYVRDQKSIRIQVGVDGDFGLPVWQYPEVAKAGSARFCNVQVKTVLLPKVLAVINGLWGKMGK